MAGDGPSMDEDGPWATRDGSPVTDERPSMTGEGPSVAPDRPSAGPPPIRSCCAGPFSGYRRGGRACVAGGRVARMDDRPPPPPLDPDPAAGPPPVPRGRMRLAALARWACRGRVMVASAIVLAVALGVVGYVQVVLLGAQYGRSPGDGILTSQSPIIAMWEQIGSPPPRWSIEMPMERTRHGPLWDTARWELVFFDGTSAVAAPDAVVRAGALEEVRGDLDIARSGSNPASQYLEAFEVAEAMLLAGELVRVEVDERLRAWNIAWHAALVLAVVLAAHLLAAGLLRLHARATGNAGVPRALAAPAVALLVAASVLIPLAAALWLVDSAWVHPTWPLAIWPLAVLVLVLAVAMPLGASRVRRARAMEYAACTRCLYDLRDSPGAGTCPECGQAYERERTAAMWRGAPGSPG